MRWLWIWLTDGRRLVGGQSCPLWAKYFFVPPHNLIHCLRTQCETKSMGWWDDALLFIFNISAFDSRLRNCTSPQSQDWFLQNSGKTKISWEMFEMKPLSRSKLIFDNLYSEYQGLLMIREVRGKNCPFRPCPLRGVHMWHAMLSLGQFFSVICSATSINHTK